MVTQSHSQPPGPQWASTSSFSPSVTSAPSWSSASVIFPPFVSTLATSFSGCPGLRRRSERHHLGRLLLSDERFVLPGGHLGLLLLLGLVGAGGEQQKDDGADHGAPKVAQGNRRTGSPPSVVS